MIEVIKISFTGFFMRREVLGKSTWEGLYEFLDNEGITYEPNQTSWDFGNEILVVEQI